jgi:hypothetical protein
MICFEDKRYYYVTPANRECTGKQFPRLTVAYKLIQQMIKTAHLVYIHPSTLLLI